MTTARPTPDPTRAALRREWNACIEVRIHATGAAEPADMQTGEDDDYCMASTRRDGVWNDRGVADPPLCCWRPPDHDGDHHDPYEHLDWRWEARS